MEGRRPHAKWYADACRERAKRRARGLKSAIGRPRRLELYREDPAAGHWHWLLGKFAQGYGCINRDGRAQKAHVWMWEQTYGPIPEGFELHHVCEEKGCVNIADSRHIVLLSKAAHRGEHGKLTAGVVRALRAGDISPGEAMRQCDVGAGTVWRAITGRTWAWLVD